MGAAEAKGSWVELFCDGFSRSPLAPAPGACTAGVGRAMSPGSLQRTESSRSQCSRSSGRLLPSQGLQSRWAGAQLGPPLASLQRPGWRSQGSRCAVSVLTQPGLLCSGRSAELSTASRTLPRGWGGGSHVLLPRKTTFITSKHTVTPSQGSPQGCGFAQQLDRYWIKRTRGPQPSLPLPGAGALLLPF